jgi:hypothetical protein
MNLFCALSVQARIRNGSTPTGINGDVPAAVLADHQQVHIADAFVPDAAACRHVFEPVMVDNALLRWIRV